MSQSHRSQQGFSLLETLIYATVVAGFVSAMLFAAKELIDYSERVKQQRELYETQRFLTQKFNWVLSNIQSITTPAVSASSTSLAVNKISFASNPLVVDRFNGIIRLTTGAGTPVPLNDSRYASATSLKFEYLDFGDQFAIRATAGLENAFATTSVSTIIFVR